METHFAGTGGDGDKYPSLCSSLVKTQKGPLFIVCVYNK